MLLETATAAWHRSVGSWTLDHLAEAAAGLLESSEAAGEQDGERQSSKFSLSDQGTCDEKNFINYRRIYALNKFSCIPSLVSPEFFKAKVEEAGVSRASMFKNWITFGSSRHSGTTETFNRDDEKIISVAMGKEECFPVMGELVIFVKDQRGSLLSREDVSSVTAHSHRGFQLYNRFDSGNKRSGGDNSSAVKIRIKSFYSSRALSLDSYNCYCWTVMEAVTTVPRRWLKCRHPSSRKEAPLSLAKQIIPPVTGCNNGAEDYFTIPSSQSIPHISTSFTSPSSQSVLSISAISVEALTVVPIHHRVRHHEFVQRLIRRPLSVSEVEALVQAVEKLGTGRWRDVKLRAFDNAKHRTYVDLKVNGPFLLLLQFAGSLLQFPTNCHGSEYL
ncbi:hypothetical protein F3Y22_tig00113145pilonHSYRG00104 [Hibiscus syriacus]|uniref:HTH myb-type domain-containing protein n=1 Tax=Hibiscus syriacus TaxID=106335 RepID=A0A6A2X6I0_HIBSY|nr:hypothetical protein F3Y22_tig00113145pilonHSYRG00104 [Hibiscus syriacus]